MTTWPTNEMSTHTCRHAGFSLIELTLVLVVVALLGSGALLTISGQVKQRQLLEAKKQMDLTIESIIGFAMTAGRLPCPAAPNIASLNGAGKEEMACVPSSCAPESAGCDCTCKLEHGVVPWQTLGLPETDAWGNRLSYFVGKEFSNPISYSDQQTGIRVRFNLETAGRANIKDDNGQTMASEIPAVIVIHGARPFGAFTSSGEKIPGATGNELVNANGTLSFVGGTPTETFDDHVAWIVPSILKSRLVSVGKLP